MKPIFLALPLMLPALAMAQPSTLYKCKDASGTILYTNQKSAKKDCIVISVLLPPAPRGAESSPAASARRASSAPTPKDFPKVSDSEQKSRDGDRRAILERELENERGNMDKARQSLTANPPPAADKAQALRDTVALHERNIEALNKELAKLK